MLVDTHVHIHEADYPLNVDDVIERAHQAGVDTMICVGTSLESSAKAVEFVSSRAGIYASLGVHPHFAKDGCDGLETLFGQEKIVAVGEVGLDYFYDNSPRDMQIAMLEKQLQLAMDHSLPVVFHVRAAFDDFWPIFDNFPGLRGELHSFTDSRQNLEKALERDLFIGVNGISTFTKDVGQQELFDAIPLQKLLLETDSPLLTPVPHRGKVNEPAFVRVVAEHHAIRRGISLEEVATSTTTNATTLFAF